MIIAQEYLKDNGTMILDLAKDLRYFKMVTNTKALIYLESLTDKGFLLGKMVRSMKVSGNKVLNMGMVSGEVFTAILILDNGLIVVPKGLEFTHTKMAISTKVNGSKT